MVSRNRGVHGNQAFTPAPSSTTTLQENYHPSAAWRTATTWEWRSMLHRYIHTCSHCAMLPSLRIMKQFSVFASFFVLLARNFEWTETHGESFLGACVTAVWRTRCPHTSHQEYPSSSRAGETCVKVLVRWAKGKRLTNRLPSLSLTTISPPGTDRIYGSTRGTNSRFQFLGIRKNFSDSWREEIHFSL